MTTLGNITYDEAIHFHNDSDEQKNGILTVSKDNLERLDHPEWAPTWDVKDDHAFEHIKPFRHVDRALFADPTFKSLTENKNVTVRKVSPKLGLEVDGIQLSKLTDKQKDDLALLVEEKGVIAFRNQDFKFQRFDDIRKWGSTLALSTCTQRRALLSTTRSSTSCSEEAPRRSRRRSLPTSSTTSHGTPT